MSTDPQELPGLAENNRRSSENPALEQLLGHVPELSARKRGGSSMYRWLLGILSTFGRH